ncbi:MAG: hypothetical protein HYV09_18645 [Deltaproteobacteria bacterium]|nr:hypothetical protein [Deltaproteobacteria bacterium]
MRSPLAATGLGLAALAALAALGALAPGCGPRRSGHGTTGPTIGPPPPPPPGSTTVWGPLRVEAVDPVRSDVGWVRDFVRATRVVAFDVVLAQDRAQCPDAVTASLAKVDERGCRGVDAFPASCKVEPAIRARVEVEVVHAIELGHKCAGDAMTYVPNEDDPRASLTVAGRTCFKSKNKLKPESTWTSLYELTELRFSERVAAVRTPFASALAAVLLAHDEGKKTYCRDDGAYLDGTAGAPVVAPTTAPIALAELLVARAARPPLEGDGVPLTGDAFRSEHALWESCNTKAARESLVARERCLLLRQLDRFLRDVEDLARPDTPKGMAAPATSGGAP